MRIRIVCFATVVLLTAAVPLHAQTPRGIEVGAFGQAANIVSDPDPVVAFGSGARLGLLLSGRWLVEATAAFASSMVQDAETVYIPFHIRVLGRFPLEPRNVPRELVAGAGIVWTDGMEDGPTGLGPAALLGLRVWALPTMVVQIAATVDHPWAIGPRYGVQAGVSAVFPSARRTPSR